MSYTAKDKREALDRELSYRRRVFPRLVSNGKMAQYTADTQIAIFEAIRDDYENQEQGVREALRLLNSIAPAIEDLCSHQGQCDMHGIIVKVSRQAIDETVNAVNDAVIALAALSTTETWAGESAPA